MAELGRGLAAFDLAQPRPLEPVIDWVVGRLEHGTAQAPVAIGQHVIRAMALRAGLPEDSTGRFTVNTSDANYEALICALTRADALFADEGARAFAGPVAIYVSRESQTPWQEIALRSGIGRAAARLVATDDTGCMEVRALADAIREDRRHGTVPVLIAANAGTIGARLVDPLEPCATIARECNIWYHIDAAWGGAALCSEHVRDELAGIELADSVTIDAHAWLAAGMSCGMLIVRDPGSLDEPFGSGREAQWLRHVIGVRVFVSLATAGWRGYGAHVKRVARLEASLL